MIKEKDKVRIIGYKTSQVYGTPTECREKVNKYMGKEGIVVNVNFGYQTPKMYTVMFKMEPVDLDCFFEYEVEKV